MAGEKKILVVEDDAINAHVLSEFFGAYGYRVVVARDGQAGEEVFAREEPDLVLIDVLLPLRNGYDVYDKLRGTDRGRRTPIFMMSAIFENIDDVHAVLPPGRRAQAYFTKPFDLGVLLANVQFYLGD